MGLHIKNGIHYGSGPSKASQLSIVDTEGLVGTAGSVTNTQTLIDALAEGGGEGVLLKDGSVAAEKLTIGARGTGTEGYGSIANGSNVVASGALSHAEGSASKATESSAHAEGIISTASGQGSHAEGNNTTASSFASHAEGNASTASGQYSHAEGMYTTASGMASHTEGSNTIAGYDFQHVLGMNNDNKSNTLFEVGNGAYSSARSNAFEVYTDGHINVNGDIYQNGAKMIFPQKAALPTASLSESGNIYQYVGATTENLTNGFFYKCVEDSSTTPSSYSWEAIQVQEGGGSGGSNVGKDLSGQSVHPTSTTTVTAGTGAEIFNDYRERAFSDADASAGNIASGAYSHAEGTLTTAMGDYAHAEGYCTIASNNSAHAEGWRTKSSNATSHAEGYYTTASGNSSHAEGMSAIASGDCSHTEGFHTTAKGAYSHAEGYYTTAGYTYQHVSGKYNNNKTDTLLEIGNGTGSNAKSNAFEVYSDGHINANGEICKNGVSIIGEISDAQWTSITALLS